MQPYNDPAWDTFFSACEDLGVTLCNHGGAGASGGTYPGAMSIAKYELSMMTRICPMDQLSSVASSSVTPDFDWSTRSLPDCGGSSC